MTLLPAVVPPVPETRAELVAARLARKVAPLFGVPWPDTLEPNPLGRITWVTDFTRVTLSEIARGAPLPTRAQAAQLAGAAELGTRGWVILDRMAATASGATLPNEIANATLNRFGPDTKAAVVLVAVNRLLDPLRAALTEVLPVLAYQDGSRLIPDLRLAAWAAVVVEVFRSQPALVAAGIRARAVQRPLTTAWEVPLAPSAAAESLTRCEISAPRTTASPVLPRDLDLVDTTLPGLALPAAEGPVGQQAAHELVAGQLLHRLLDVGTLRDTSHLWISARGPGQLALEALLTPDSIIDQFVAQALRALPPVDGGPVDARLPALPDAAALAQRPLATRRTAAIALFGAVRQVLTDAQARERLRLDAFTWLGQAHGWLAGILPADDPVRAVAGCRADVLRLDLVRYDAERDKRVLVEALMASSQYCIDLFERGSLDRGAAAEILSAANRQLDTLRRLAEASCGPPADGTPPAGILDDHVRRGWLVWLRMVEIDPAVLTTGPLPDLLAHHLHNYATYLASHPYSSGDLTQAVDLFRDVVLPARARYVARTAVFEPLRVSLQMATAATTGLARLARAAGHSAQARNWAALGHLWINRALADPGTAAMLDEATESACRLALQAVPALLLAVELQVSPDGVGTAADLAAVDRLLSSARRWISSLPGPFARQDEIDALAARREQLPTT
ncbi:MULTISPECIES: hypothetical protein [Frankia]|uniref:hypothetical protein n=1 Tax=Frankia TaxID=1854 RepID=UPI0011D111C2|nr:MULTISPECIES: hypothetical protein [Frankia]